jgi:two-component system cell cycle response regulator
MDSVLSVPHILAIDDSPLNLKILKSLLEKECYTVTTCQDPTQAFRIVEETQPSLVLLDVMMPEVDGLTVLKQIKATDATQAIPVVMVTARTGGEDVELALDHGAFDYIKKPIEAVETLARVRSALRYRKQQDQLIELASSDSLTKVYNHGLLLDLLDRELQLGRRTEQPTAFLMIDVDHFKAVNDRHGHQVGDSVLRHLAALLKDSVRRTDAVGRYGGEEFGVVLGNCDLESARILAEKLRTTVESAPVDGATGAVNLTISVGVVCVPAGEIVVAEEVVRRADGCLYRAKESGRNRVICYTA